MGSPQKRFKEQTREELAALRAQLASAREECRTAKAILANTLHEVMQFSAVISDRSRALSQEIVGDKRLCDLSDNIFYASGMLSARLGFTAIEINPSIVSKQVKFDSVVYKKFDKARYLIKALSDGRNVSVDFHGESHMAIMTIPAFDMVPFVILQNAVKYSPLGYTVDVYFESDDYGGLEVRVSSYGPPVGMGEIKYLFDRGYRGRESVSYEGQGLGLYLAKRVCDLHGVGVEISQGDFLKHSIAGRDYQRFIVRMYFERLD